MTNIEQLASELLKHRVDYEMGNPTITDAQYDALELQLRKLSPNHPIFNMVGAGLLGLNSKHIDPMLSQEKALTIDAAVKWLEKRVEDEEEFIASLKHDGMSCALHYAKGELLKAVSRGDGEYGKDITAKVSLIVPKNLPVDFTGEVRGELVLSLISFEKLNASLLLEGKEQMKTIRNAVPGIINEEAISYEKIKFLDFRCFGIIWRCSKELKYSIFEGNGKDTYVSDMEFLRGVGFKIAFYTVFYVYVADNIKDILTDVLEDFIQYRNGNSEEELYPCDGVVFRVNDQELYSSLGNTSHHPRGAIAWKFAADSVIVVIKSIEWSVGTKDISPVGIFEPTIIGGALIQRVSLKSVKNMVEKGCTIGSEVEVVRSGDVIPWMKRVL